MPLDSTTYEPWSPFAKVYWAAARQFDRQHKLCIGYTYFSRENIELGGCLIHNVVIAYTKITGEPVKDYNEMAVYRPLEKAAADAGFNNIISWHDNMRSPQHMADELRKVAMQCDTTAAVS